MIVIVKPYSKRAIFLFALSAIICYTDIESTYESYVQDTAKEAGGFRCRR